MCSDGVCDLRPSYWADPGHAEQVRREREGDREGKREREGKGDRGRKREREGYMMS